MTVASATQKLAVRSVGAYTVQLKTSVGQQKFVKLLFCISSII
jgi:hypothetical protein